VFSLYGEVRRPTGQSLGTFDTILIDLQDLGCRIYTFITTLLYVLEAAAEQGKAVWVLDRPNPAGRPIEGMTLLPAGKASSAPGRSHAPRFNFGRARPLVRRSFQARRRLSRDRDGGLRTRRSPRFGWPADRIWINPSPNAANLNMARAYAGTVMLEGATLSRRARHHPPARTVRRARYRRPRRAAEMHDLPRNGWRAALLRDCWFEPNLPQA
jgi:uncharacterized protein YbbC (DUF1343 family)